MKNKLEKKYNLFTAICLVIGIVIGSGIFFKAENILKITNGNIIIGIIALLIGGTIMIVSAYNFANFASKYEKMNGLVDYSESIIGNKYGYFVGWFISTIYYPAMTAVLAWVCARYTLLLFGDANPTTGLCMTLSAVYLISIFTINMLAPKISGVLQISSTIIKLVPLIIMAIVGSIAGLINQNTIESFKLSIQTAGEFNGMFAAIVSGAFAYEGWIIATSINSELKDSKKNLPIALVVGTFIIMVIYIVYFIGLCGGASIEELEQNPLISYSNIFGNFAGTLLLVFIIISCIGTLNGLMFANVRSLYSISLRNKGPKIEVLNQVDDVTNIPNNSGVVGLLLCVFWLLYFYMGNLSETNLLGVFAFDSSELPIVTLYVLYIPIYIMFIKKEGKNDWKKNIIMPILGIIASLFMIFAAVYAHGITYYLEAQKVNEFSFPILFYLIVTIVIMGIGMLFYKKEKKLDK